MPVKLITLNIEGHHHLDRFLPFLEREQADVVCLQEVFAADMPRIQQVLGLSGAFAPMMRVEQQNRYRIDTLGEWGIALFSRLPHTEYEHVRYRGTGGSLPEFANFPNSPWRVLLSTQVQLPSGGACIVATTHFTWSQGGETTPEQLRDFESLWVHVSKLEQYVLCGDLNAPRGRQLHRQFSDQLVDAVPATLKTTLDHELHYAGPLNLVVDGIFHTPGVAVSEVRAVSGVSDHLALVGMLSLTTERTQLHT